MTTVREVMSTDLVTVEPTDTVAHAATTMGKHQTGSALVMEGGSLAGIFTERDIVRALGAEFDAPGDPVSTWMTKNPTSVEPGIEADAALALMLSGGFRHLPVVEGATVLGVVSMRDLTRAAVEE